MSKFINDAFIKIRQIYGVDFTNNTGMGISIALHVTALIVRVKHNMQIHGKSLENVKRTFLLCEKYIDEKKVSTDEIALIAAHFYDSLLELHQTKKRTRVLVLSSMEVSMTILLRSILMETKIVSGMLLYARTDEATVPNNSYLMSGTEFVWCSTITETFCAHCTR